MAAMATNLRLSPEAEAALRAEAERSGRSQQAVIRDALDRLLGLAPPKPLATELRELVATGEVDPPRVPYRRPRRRLSLPDGVTSADLLDRSDRL
jgi:predicted DNA-binding protein